MRVYRPTRKKRRNKPPATEAASAEAFVGARRYCRGLGIRERITPLGGEPVANSPEAFAAISQGDIAKWKQVAKTANVTAD